MGLQCLAFFSFYTSLQAEFTGRTSQICLSRASGDRQHLSCWAFSLLFSPELVQCSHDLRVFKSEIRVVLEEDQELSDGSALRCGKTCETASAIIVKVSERKHHPIRQGSFELCEKERWQMEPHAVCIEEGQTAVAPIQIIYGEPSPFGLLVTRPLLGDGGLVCVVVQGLAMPQSHATTERDASKGVSDQLGDMFVFGFHLFSPTSRMRRFGTRARRGFRSRFSIRLLGFLLSFVLFPYDIRHSAIREMERD